MLPLPSAPDVRIVDLQLLWQWQNAMGYASAYCMAFLTHHNRGRLHMGEGVFGSSPVIGAAKISLACCAHHQLRSCISLVHCSHPKRPCRALSSLAPCNLMRVHGSNTHIVESLHMH